MASEQAKTGYATVELSIESSGDIVDGFYNKMENAIKTGKIIIINFKIGGVSSNLRSFVLDSAEIIIDRITFSTSEYYFEVIKEDNTVRFADRFAAVAYTEGAGIDPTSVMSLTIDDGMLKQPYIIYKAIQIDIKDTTSNNTFSTFIGVFGGTIKNVYFNGKLYTVVVEQPIRKQFNLTITKQA